MKYRGKRSSVSGFPVEWIKVFSFDGEYNCDYCTDNNTDMCCECADYGTDFNPTEEALALLEKAYPNE